MEAAACRFSTARCTVRRGDHSLIAHPITEGVADLGYGVGSGLVAYLASAPYGAGRVVFCGDMNMWEWIPQPLVDNLLAWFAQP